MGVRRLFRLTIRSDCGGCFGGHIRWLGDGGYGFRPYGGSLLKSAKVTKTLLPHHSAPRLGSVCPHSGSTERAAATGRPCPVAAKPASCRFTRSVLPAFGQRGLTGRLRSRSRSRSRSTARRPSSRPEWLDQKRTRGGLTADLMLEAELNQRWELACLRWYRLGVPDRPSCLHRRQASSHRKAKALRCWRLHSVKLWERACSRRRWVSQLMCS